jgi:hypothetical protein
VWEERRKEEKHGRRNKEIEGRMRGVAFSAVF